MAIKYTEAEFMALEKKLREPEKKVICPRCGNILVYRSVGNSSETKCLTEGCIKATLRGL